jgi:hypothetical protein
LFAAAKKVNVPPVCGTPATVVELVVVALVVVAVVVDTVWLVVVTVLLVVVVEVVPVEVVVVLLPHDASTREATSNKLRPSHMVLLFIAFLLFYFYLKIYGYLIVFNSVQINRTPLLIFAL